MGGEITVPKDDNGKKPVAPPDKVWNELFPPADTGGGGGKLNDGGGGKLNEGGGKLEPRDADPEKVRQLTETTRGEAAAAARGGDVTKLQQSLKTAFEQLGGDQAAFKAFGQQLAKDLGKDGITVKAGNGVMSMHRDGSPTGVEFKMDGKVDFQTGKVKADVKAQTYDWVTKKDVPGNAADALKSPDAATRANGVPRDAKELGSAYEDAFNARTPAEKDAAFAKLNKDMAASFEQAFKRGGMAAVKELEKQVNDSCPNAPGSGPVVVETANGFRVVNVGAMSEDAQGIAKTLADAASPQTPDARNKALAAIGAVETKDYGVMKVINAGTREISARVTANK
jgi:hypothetical protein